MYYSKGRQTLGAAFLLLLVFAGASGQTKSFSGTAEELLGLWSGEGEMIEFRSDGQCRYGDNLYPYSLVRDFLVIELPGGAVTFAWNLKAGQLVLTKDGQQSVYTRVAGVRQVTPTFKDQRNPPDLFGKWCYLKSSAGSHTDQCITLRPDGTYLFAEETRVVTDSPALDSGTWYLDRQRLYYQSRKRGLGYYRFERRSHPVNPQDPMIVLDDKPFVSVTRNEQGQH